MSLSYNYAQYITKVMMSKKHRILVEGKDDKSHLKNLIHTMFGIEKKTSIEIDTAEQIKADSRETAKSNREKIITIYRKTVLKPNIDKLFSLCDREFDSFIVASCISETPVSNVKPLYFTTGHSFENFFLTESVISNALSCHTSSEFKPEALDIFQNNFNQIFKIISCISLTAKDLEIASYPNGKIYWDSFSSINGIINLDIEEWCSLRGDMHSINFKNHYLKYIPIVSSTDLETCIRISRGHTAITMLQRLFAYCLFLAGQPYDESLALREAKAFANISESQITSSLSQFWLNSIQLGLNNYPVSLIDNFSDVQLA